MKRYLYETHLHTSTVSRCATASPAEQVRLYHRLGYDGICITDHFFNGNSYKFPELPWEKQIDFFESGYLLAKEEGDRLGIKVFFGWEYSLGGGTDFLTYGLGADFLRAHPELLELSFPEYAALVHENGGTIIQAHPFRLVSYIPMIRLDPRNVDAVEIDNAANTDLANRLAAYYAEQYGFPSSAGSDNHFGALSRYAAVASDVPLETVQDLMRAILARRTRLISIRPEESL